MARITFLYDADRLRRREEAEAEDRVGERSERNTTARRLFRRIYGRDPGLVDGDIDSLSFEEIMGYTPGDQ